MIIKLKTSKRGCLISFLGDCNEKSIQSNLDQDCCLKTFKFLLMRNAITKLFNLGERKLFLSFEVSYE